jgi:toxin ParE1/3/4
VKALLFSPAAEIDLANIWDYSADNWGPDQADRYTDEIRDACKALVIGHKQGKTVDVRPGYMKLPTGSHVVYFRDYSDQIHVMRILHSRMDVALHL